MSQQSLHINTRREQLAAAMRGFRRNWDIFARNRLALVGLVVLFLFSLAPITFNRLRQGAWKLSMYDPITGFDLDTAPHPTPPSWIPAEQLAEDDIHRMDIGRPSARHLLGTDTLGRDILAVLLASTGHSFLVGITAAVVTAIIGVILAAYAAYYGGWVDLLLGYVSDAFLLLPAPIFMIGVGSWMRANSTSLTEIIFTSLSDGEFTDRMEFFWQPVEFGIIYGLIAGMGAAAIILRSHALKVMAMAFIEASRVAGASAQQIIWRHLIPHMLPLAVVYMLVTVTGAVVADGFLSFIGFNPNPLNWGTMIYNTFEYQNLIQASFPWNAVLAPALAISAFASAFFLISRGIQDVIEPRQRSDYFG